MFTLAYIFEFCKFLFVKKSDISLLEALLIKEKVKEAWTVSLDAVFSKELQTANRNFGQACRNLKHIRPLAVCNPLSDRAGTLLEDAVASGLFAGVCFSPYIHAFHPLNGNFADQLELCSRKHIPVFLNFGISEYRFRPDGFAPRAAGNELEQLLAQLPANTYTIQGIPYFPCNPPQNVRLQFWNGREADRHNDPAKYQELPSNAIWVQESEYPFRPLQS